MDNLASYKQAHGLSHAKLAERLGLSSGFLSQIMNGTRMPGPETAARIEKVTDGAVPFRSWPNIAAILDAASS